MQAVASTRGSAALHQAVSSSSAAAAAARGSRFVTFYADPPTEEISLAQFELWAMDRMRVLRQIDTARIRGIKGAEMDNLIETVVNKYLPTRTEEDRQKDIVSHHTLRLAFCRNVEDRRFFVTNEAALFRWRLREEGPAQLVELLRANNVSYAQMSPDQWATHSEALARLYHFLGTSELRASSFFCVPWTHAVSLVSRRSVLLAGGTAFCHRDDMVEIVVARYRSLLAEALALAVRCQSQIREDQRVAKLVEAVTRRDVDQAAYKVNTNSGEVSLNDLDALAARSFPLCMRNLHQRLRDTHHLKHGGRMQYGLFLKGIGLTLQDALAFWRSEFAQKVGVDKFDKTYAYNIRHNYGQEGKRTDYTPYSCAKIINGDPPGAEDHHGCPFRHFDAARLHSAMSAAGVDEAAIKDIATLLSPTNGGPHYQIACRRYFEALHPNASNDLTMTHPNRYFEASMRYYAEKDGDATTKGSANAAGGQSSGSKPAVLANAAPTSAAAVASAMSSDDTNDLDDADLAAMDI